MTKVTQEVKGKKLLSYNAVTYLGKLRFLEVYEY